MYTLHVVTFMKANSKPVFACACLRLCVCFTVFGKAYYLVIQP